MAGGDNEDLNGPVLLLKLL